MTREKEQNGAGVPALSAAARTLRSRVRAVARAVGELRDEPGEERVHRLRVATRRSAAALSAFGPLVRRKRGERVSRTLRRLRKVSGAPRDADVRRKLLETMRREAGDGQGALLDELIARTETEQTETRDRLTRVIDEVDPDELRALGRGVVRKGAEVGSLGAFAGEALARVRNRIESCGEEEDAERLHDLRLAIKDARYTVELFKRCLPREMHAALRELLRGVQDSLGELNDVRMLGRWVIGVTETMREDGSTLVDEAEALRERCAEVERSRCGVFLSAWRTGLRERVLEGLADAERVCGSSGSAPEDADSRGAGPRLAAIDVGSNTVRLLIADMIEGGYATRADRVATTRLVAGAHADGTLDPESADRTLSAVVDFVHEARRAGATSLRVVATSGVREAADGEAFARRVSRECGVEVEVLSGEDEARLVHRSAGAHYDLSRGRVGVVDIGGGSTEFVLSADGQIVRSGSAPIGAVRLTDRFGGPERVVSDRFGELLDEAEMHADRLVGRLPFVPAVLVGSGGTVVTLGSMLLARAGEHEREAHGFEARRADLARAIVRLREMDGAARRRVPGLAPERADIIVAGLAILDRVMERLRVNSVVVSDGGVRDGLMLSMIDGLVIPDRRGGDVMSSVRRFAKSCGVDMRHAARVAEFAVAVYDGAELGREELRGLLAAAAMLHEVGELVGVSGRHKHGAELIRHAELNGLSDREREIVALTVRYHRGARPSARHVRFARMGESDRDAVVRMASALRIAAALDADHSGLVGSVEIRVREGTAWFTASASGGVSGCLKDCERRADLFEEVTGLRTRFGWVRSRKRGEDGTENGAGRPGEQALGRLGSAHRGGEPAPGAGGR